jgi:hypothetical protein
MKGDQPALWVGAISSGNPLLPHDTQAVVSRDGFLAPAPDARIDAYQMCGSLAAWDALRPTGPSPDAVLGELS